MTPMRRHVVRDLEFIYRREELVARMAPEGVYLKGKGRRWTSGIFLSWASVYDFGAIVKSKRIREERAAKRKARREGRTA